MSRLRWVRIKASNVTHLVEIREQTLFSRCGVALCPVNQAEQLLIGDNDASKRCSDCSSGREVRRG